MGFNPLNAELNPICHLLALLGAHHILHVSRVRVKGLKFELRKVAFCLFVLYNNFNSFFTAVSGNYEKGNITVRNGEKLGPLPVTSALSRAGRRKRTKKKVEKEYEQKECRKDRIQEREK